MKTYHSASLLAVLRTAIKALMIVAVLQCFSNRGQSSLGIRLTPTVSVSGPIGTWQQIQYSDDVDSPTNWTPLTNLLLTHTPTVFTDTSNAVPRRFYRSVTLTNVTNTNMVWIPAGTFLMGSPEDEAGRNANEGPQTLVTLTQGFFISKFEVTQLEYVSVIGSYTTLFGGNIKSNDFAIGTVIWDEAANYCSLLTQRELAAFRIPPGWTYRLPTEAEWEYACRAGTTTVFAYGNAIYNSTVQGSLANFDGRIPYPSIPTNDVFGIFSGHPITVGLYPANGFDLHDMQGNAAEWCLDGFANSTIPGYAGGSVTNPIAVGPFYHAIRGGSYASAGVACRSAARSTEIGGSLNYGFRVVLAPTGP
jgi:formylglycine-generating enzyme required for sulfatase activity